MVEIELKFLIDERDAARLRDGAAARALSAGGRARRRRLRSIYFDTEDRALAARGATLRLRAEGAAWTQTVKRGAGSFAGGLSTPQEAEAPAPGAAPDPDLIPDAGLRKLVRKAVGSSPLVAMFETDISRATRILRTAEGAAELAVDVGEVIAGDRRERIAEVELELVEGPPSALYDIASKLFEDVPVRFSDRSKAQRGFALAAGGAAVPPPAPAGAVEAALRRGDSVETAMIGVLRSCLAQIAANAACCRVCDDIEGPHQLRIGLRRLRSAIALFGPALRGPDAADLAARARRLGAAVGRLRDLDVLIEQSVRPAAERQRDPAAFDALLGALEARRADVAGAVRAELSGAPTNAFLLDLSRFVELRGWRAPDDPAQAATLSAPIRPFARAALDARWRRTRRKARRIETLSDEARHDLRKALKKLRYGVDFFGGLFPRKARRPFLRRLKRLQDVFGALNDAAAAEAALTGPEAPARDDPAAQRAAGRVLGAGWREARRALREARADWRALRALGPFWR